MGMEFGGKCALGNVGGDAGVAFGSAPGKHSGAGYHRDARRGVDAIHRTSVLLHVIGVVAPVLFDDSGKLFA